MPPKFSPLPIGHDDNQENVPPPPLPPGGQVEVTSARATTTLDYNNAKEWIPIPSGSRQSTAPRHDPEIPHEGHGLAVPTIHRTEPDRSNYGIKNFEGK